jgi:hypothetical protein
MNRARITAEDRVVAELLLRTFRPRLDLYAQRLDDEDQVQRLNEWMAQKIGAADAARRTWRVGDWKPAGPKDQRKPVTIDAIARHVAGIETLGVYPLHPGDHCNSVSVDFDNHRGTRTTTRDPREDFDALASVLQRRGVRFLANVSRGGGGYWIHVLPPRDTPARVARSVMTKLLEEAEVKHIDDGGTVDSLFPKQDSLHVGSDGDTTRVPGNLFCLPCSRRWMSAEAPGSHYVSTNPRSMTEQIEHMRSYL